MGASLLANAVCQAALMLCADAFASRLAPTMISVSAFDQVDGEDVAWRAVQHVIRGRAEQQRQTMSAMTADHDQIARLFFGEMMDFLAWLAIGQVAVGALKL